MQDDFSIGGAEDSGFVENFGIISLPTPLKSGL